MNIDLIVIGKLKEDYLRDACAEYIKRLGRYCKFELHELDECKLSETPSEKEIAAALKKEGEQIKRFAKGMIVPMCIEGKQLTSPELAEKISSAGVAGVSNITFIIGSFGKGDGVGLPGFIWNKLTDQTGHQSGVNTAREHEIRFWMCQ